MLLGHSRPGFSAERSREHQAALGRAADEHAEAERPAEPIFDWKRVCPREFDRPFPAVVGTGRGEVFHLTTTSFGHLSRRRR